jgi:hypothetical protein
MSLEDLEPFGLEWELEQNERMFGEAPLESEHSMAHREAAQLGRSCPFDCDPDGGWVQVGEDEWVSPRDAAVAADRAEAREFPQEPPW